MTLPSGRTILIDEIEVGDLAERSGGDETYKDVGFGIEFKDIVESAVEVGKILRDGIERIRPSKASAEITFGVDAKTGKIAAVFVEGAARGGVKLVLEWKCE